MGRYHKACLAIAAAVSLLAGSVWGTGTGFAKEIDPNDPDYNTPGFPLPTIENDENDSPLTGGRIDWGITDDTPAPFTVLNYGGLPLPVDNFVNIGDSYTTTAFYATTLPEPCFHNAIGFATAVGAQTGLAVRDAACAGAGIPFYWHTMKSFQFPVAKAPQRLAIDKHTKLVVVSLGGNDTYTNSMIAVLAGCIASWSIPKYYNQGNPCARKMAPEMMPRAKALVPALTYMYKEAKKRAAKDAVVIAMGYFNPLPMNTENCLIDGPAPKGDLKFINEIFTVINRSIRTAAKKAGVLYYNPSAEQTYAQTSCGAPFARMISITGLPEYSVPFHPTLTGHYNAAEHVVKLYNQELTARQRGTTIAPQTWKAPYHPAN